MLSIIIAISITATGCMGFLNFHVETRPEELWVDIESAAYRARGIARTFPTRNRIKLIVTISAPTVLDSDVLALVCLRI